MLRSYLDKCIQLKLTIVQYCASSNTIKNDVLTISCKQSEFRSLTPRRTRPFITRCTDFVIYYYWTSVVYGKRYVNKSRSNGTRSYASYGTYPFYTVLQSAFYVQRNEFCIINRYINYNVLLKFFFFYFMFTYYWYKYRAP